MVVVAVVTEVVGAVVVLAVASVSSSIGSMSTNGAGLIDERDAAAIIPAVVAVAVTVAVVAAAADVLLETIKLGKGIPVSGPVEVRRDVLPSLRRDCEVMAA